jgi:site-specific DNA recombinase
MKRVVIYARVSDKDKQDEQSQINELKKVCQIENWYHVDTFSEKISGAVISGEREKLSGLIDFVENPMNKIDGILVWEISRLGRRISDIATLLERFHSKKIFIYSKKDRLKTLTDDGTIDTSATLLIHIMGSIAENERILIKSRSARGVIEARKKGHWIGKITPYGYRKDGKKLVIDEEEAEVVKTIFDLYLHKKMGTQSIANFLNEKGIPTKFNKIFDSGKIVKTRYGRQINKDDFKWVDGTIYSIITNTIYIGRIRSKDKKLELDSPKIIDNDTFKRVEKLRKDSYSKKANNVIHNHLFDSRKIKCGLCDRNFYPHRRSNLKDNRYICIGKRNKEGKNVDGKYIINNKCPLSIGIGIPMLNDSVWYWIRRSDYLLERIEEDIDKSSIKNDINNIEIEINKFTILKENLLRNENTILQLFLSQRLSEENYNNQQVVMGKEIKKIDKKILLLEEELQNLKLWEEKQNTVTNQLKNIKNTPSIMKSLVNDIVRQVTIYPVSEDFSLSGVKGERCVYVELFLLTSHNPIMFIISQRTAFINGEKVRWLLELNKGDFNNGKVIGDIKKIKGKQRHKIKYKVGF